MVFTNLIICIGKFGSYITILCPASKDKHNHVINITTDKSEACAVFFLQNSIFKKEYILREYQLVIQEIISVLFKDCHSQVL